MRDRIGESLRILGIVAAYLTIGFLTHWVVADPAAELNRFTAILTVLAWPVILGFAAFVATLLLGGAALLVIAALTRSRRVAVIGVVAALIALGLAKLACEATMTKKWIYKIATWWLYTTVYLTLYAAFGVLTAYGFQGNEFNFGNAETWSIIFLVPTTMAGIILIFNPLDRFLRKSSISHRVDPTLKTGNKK